jgi:alkane 1-monooxygenase
MNIKPFKYLSPLIIYVLSIISFTHSGWLCWLAMMYAWLLIPLIELFLLPDTSNMQSAEEELAKKDKLYDYILYLIVFLQVPTLFFFLFSMKDIGLSVEDIIGRIFTMGLLCGTFGINVAHELGHRVNSFEQTLAKVSLLTSLYMHFFIEHNKGHHKNVATPEDPSSAPFGQTVYAFWVRTISGTYKSAWYISNEETKKKNHAVISFWNEMFLFQIIQLLFIGLIFLLFGWKITLYFLTAAVIGFLLLETVNYIEHYGLQRKEIDKGKFERALPQHSWNSDHVIGRLMLFELSRHSDHHYLASRKYQILRHHENAPQMPTGYPGMMLLSLCPPAWFYVMHKQMKKFNLLP